MHYISIDGDDIGRKITSCYLSNDSKKLQYISNELKNSTENIANYLEDRGFDIIFCAADGITASIQKPIDFSLIFQSIGKLFPKSHLQIQNPKVANLSS